MRSRTTIARFIFLLLFAVSLPAQEPTENAEDRTAISAIVKQYVAKISSRDYAAAAALFHSPAAMRAEDRSSLTAGLTMIHKELGGIRSIHRFETTPVISQGLASAAAH